MQGITLHKKMVTIDKSTSEYLLSLQSDGDISHMNYM